MDLSQSRTNYENKSHSQVLSNTSEQDVEIFTNLRDFLHIDLDLDAITKITIIRIFEKVDGTNFGLVSEVTYDPSGSTGDFDVDVQIVGIELNGGGQDMKITMQSVVAETMSITVNYSLEVLTRP